MEQKSSVPVAVATWKFGLLAVNAAAPILSADGNAIDAIEKGINIVEENTDDQYYVGLGGLPNSEGKMEFDAALMCGQHMTYGAVMAMPHIFRAISVARLVMDISEHSILSGEGASAFAIENGMHVEETLTFPAQQHYESWKSERKSNVIQGESSKTDPPHDTIGMICLDAKGHLAAGTSTTGWPFKHPGRVGDSPVIGSGLYCDDKAGAAVATGDGEEILRANMCFLAVESMRNGSTPQQACEIAIERLHQIISRGNSMKRRHKKLTVAILAMNPKGEIGASSTIDTGNIHRGRPVFPYTVWRAGDAAGHIAEEKKSV